MEEYKTYFDSLDNFVNYQKIVNEFSYNIAKKDFEYVLTYLKDSKNIDEDVSKLTNFNCNSLHYLAKTVNFSSDKEYYNYKKIMNLIFENSKELKKSLFQKSKEKELNPIQVAIIYGNATFIDFVLNYNSVKDIQYEKIDNIDILTFSYRCEKFDIVELLITNGFICEIKFIEEILDNSNYQKTFSLFNLFKQLKYEIFIYEDEKSYSLFTYSCLIGNKDIALLFIDDSENGIYSHFLEEIIDLFNEQKNYLNFSELKKNSEKIDLFDFTMKHINERNLIDSDLICDLIDKKSKKNFNNFFRFAFCNGLHRIIKKLLENNDYLIGCSESASQRKTYLESVIFDYSDIETLKIFLDCDIEYSNFRNCFQQTLRECKHIDKEIFKLVVLSYRNYFFENNYFQYTESLIKDSFVNGDLLLFFEKRKSSKNIIKHLLDLKISIFEIFGNYISKYVLSIEQLIEIIKKYSNYDSEIIDTFLQIYESQKKNNNFSQKILNSNDFKNLKKIVFENNFKFSKTCEYKGYYCFAYKYLNYDEFVKFFEMMLSKFKYNKNYRNEIKEKFLNEEIINDICYNTKIDCFKKITFLMSKRFKKVFNVRKHLINDIDFETLLFTVSDVETLDLIFNLKSENNTLEILNIEETIILRLKKYNNNNTSSVHKKIINFIIKKVRENKIIIHLAREINISFSAYSTYSNSSNYQVRINDYFIFALMTYWRDPYICCFGKNHFYFLFKKLLTRETASLISRMFDFSLLYYFSDYGDIDNVKYLLKIQNINTEI